jgi:hypothetical protein
MTHGSPLLCAVLTFQRPQDGTSARIIYKNMESTMTSLRTVPEIFETSGADTVIANAIPLTSDLLDFSQDYFPPFFRGFCACAVPHLSVSAIEEIEIPEIAYVEPDMIARVPRVIFMVEDCPLEIVQKFTQAYEGRHATGAGDDNELIVLNLSRVSVIYVPHSSTSAAEQPVAPELPIAHPPNA